MIGQEINQIETSPIILPGWEINNIGIKYPAGLLSMFLQNLQQKNLEDFKVMEILDYTSKCF